VHAVAEVGREGWETAKDETRRLDTKFYRFQLDD